MVTFYVICHLGHSRQSDLVDVSLLRDSELGPLSSLLVGLDRHELLGLELLVSDGLSGSVDVIGTSSLDTVVGMDGVGETHLLGLSLSGQFGDDVGV